MLAIVLSWLFVESAGESRLSKIACAILSPFFFFWGILKVIAFTIVGIAKTCWPAGWFFKLDLDGKIVLVTGGANGLGAHLCTHLAKQGARVVLWDVDREASSELCEAIARDGGEIHGYYCDVSSCSEVMSTASIVSEEIGEVDIVINNAGMANILSLSSLSADQIKRCINVNLLSNFWTTKAFLPSMLERNSGFIVSISSTAGVVGTSMLSDYCASKFAIVGFIESLKIELQQLNATGVKTMIVCPYFIRTRMFHGVRTRYQWILPMLEPEDTAVKIIRAMRSWQEVLYLPRASYFLLALKGIIPLRALSELGYLFGAHTAMRDAATGGAAHVGRPRVGVYHCPLIDTV